MSLQTEHHTAKLQWPEQMEATAYHHEAAGAVTCCRSLAACAGTCRAGACEAAVTAELFRGLAAVSPHSTESLLLQSIVFSVVCLHRGCKRAELFALKTSQGCLSTFSIIRRKSRRASLKSKSPAYCVMCWTVLASKEPSILARGSTTLCLKVRALPAHLLRQQNTGMHATGMPVKMAQ